MAKITDIPFMEGLDIGASAKVFGDHTQDKQIVIVDMKEWRGRKGVDVRQYYRDDDGKFHPGKGIRFSPEIGAGVAHAILKLCEIEDWAQMLDEASLVIGTE